MSNDAWSRHKKEKQSNGIKERQKSNQIISEISKTRSKEEFANKNEISLKSDFINHTYSKSTKTDDIFKLDKEKNKKINNIVKLYSNNVSDYKLESNSLTKKISMFNKNNDNPNIKKKNAFSYNSLFNKNLSSKYVD